MNEKLRYYQGFSTPSERPIVILFFYYYYYFLSFFGEFSKFFIESIQRFKYLMVESKCLVSRVIALYTSAQLNKCNIQLGFLDFRIIFFGKYFLEIFSRSLRSKSPIFLFGDQKEFQLLFFFFFWTHVGRTFRGNGRQQEKTNIIFWQKLVVPSE